MPNADEMPADTHPLATLFLACVVILLTGLGVSAALGRLVYLPDFVTRVEPFRQQLLESLGLHDRHASGRADELARFDGRFSAHPFATLMHVAPGGLFLILAPLQFSARVRSRYLPFHRWSGRVLVLASFAVGSSALYLGLLMPYGGAGEALGIALFGGLFLAAIGRAVVAILRKNVDRHREWMIRAYAFAVGISTVRAIGALLDVTLSPVGVRPTTIFVLSIWTGWVVTLGSAEVWIRVTRRRVRTRPMSSAA